MRIYRQRIDKCAQLLARNMGGNSADNQAIISYALQLLIFNSSTAIITLLLALVLGTFNITLVALLASGSLRVFIGGFHLPHPIHCLVLTVITLNLIGKLAVLLAPYATPTASIILVALVMGLALLFIIRNAPVATANRPIKEERRPGLKQKGLKVWLFWSVVLVALLLIGGDMSVYLLAIAMAIANQTLSISKIFK